MTQRGYLTPTVENGSTICRAFSIPVDFVPAFMGALGELAYFWNWEQSGDLTPDEASAICAAIIDNFSDCEDIAESETDTMTQIFPRRVEFQVDDMYITVGSTFSRTVDPTEPYNYYTSRSAPAQNDAQLVTAVLDAGVYNLFLNGAILNSAGIVSVYIDGVLVGTIDWYAGSTTHNQLQATGAFTIPTAGLHTIEFRMATKNAASSGYAYRLSHCSIRMVGA